MRFWRDLAIARFFPHNSDNLREEVAHIKDWLAREFRGSVPKSSNPRLNTFTRTANQPGGGGGGAVSGGGGGSAILGGDVSGSPVNNQVALLQGVTLTLTSPVTGDVLVFSGSAIVNSKTIGGALTVTGVLTASAAGNSLGATTVTGDLTLSTHNIVTDTVTGTKLGTVGGAAGQKLAAFGAPPVTQPLLATGVGHTVDDVILALQTLGWVRQT